MFRFLRFASRIPARPCNPFPSASDKRRTTIRGRIAALPVFGALALAGICVPVPPAHAQAVNCNGNFVSLAGVAIEVLPTGGDDTANLQCAFDEATRLDARLVRLVAGTYTVRDTIEVSGFNGNLEGLTRSSTIIRFADGEFACGSFSVEGNSVLSQGAGIRFVRGVSGVRFMTLQTVAPCGSGASFALLLFNSNPDNCSQRTFFGLVDRVDMIASAGTNALEIGVAAFAAEACPGQPALGTLKVNRSSFTDLDFGVLTSMVGGAQVDVNFNTFTDVNGAVTVVDAGQNTSIVDNTFDMGGSGFEVDGEEPLCVAIAVTTGSDSAPDGNRTVLHRNRFFDFSSADSTVHFLSTSSGVRPEHSIVITENEFQMGGADFSGAISVFDADNGVILNNVFTGNGVAGVSLGPFEFADDVTGWSIIGNDFSGLGSIDSDIVLDAGTRDNIVGPDQDATISNAGVNRVLN